MTADWEPDPDFDLDRHVVRAALPAPGGQAELEAFVSELASTDLDRDRPAWQFHFVEHFQGGSAAILRIHHCYADGMAMIRVFLSLTDAEAEPAPTAHAPASAPQAARRARRRRRLVQPSRHPGRGPAAPGVRRKARLSSSAPCRSTQNPEQAGEFARHALGIAGELTRVALLADDPPTRFKGPLGSRKIAAGPIRCRSGK